MITLRLLTFGAVILLTLTVFSLHLMWSDVIGTDSLTNACTSAVSAISVALLAGGLILAGDATFLRRRIWIQINRGLSTKIGLSALLVVSIAGLLIAAIAGVLFRTVTVSTDKSIILVLHDTPGVLQNIGRIDSNTERTVLLRTGTHLLGYRIVATECTGAYPPVEIPSWLDGPVPRIHFNTAKEECKNEVLDNPVRTDRALGHRQ